MICCPLLTDEVTCHVCDTDNTIGRVDPKEDIYSLQYIGVCMSGVV
jgi:hypothetical protein